MNKFRKEIMPVIGKMWGKGQDWFSQLVNATDHTITKVVFLLKENQKQLNDYLIDREQLLDSIKQKQAEVECLRVEIEQTTKGQTERLINLHEKLELKTDELIQHQQKYFTLRHSIDESRKKIGMISSEKDRALNERNWLKTEYDYLQIIMKESFVKQEKLEAELAQLKKKQTIAHSVPIDESILVEIEKKKAEIGRLNEANEIYTLKYKDLENQLMGKVKHISNLSGQLRVVEAELIQNEQKMVGLQSLIHEQGEEINVERKLVEQLKLERIALHSKSASYEEQYNIALMELEDKEHILRQKDDEYLHITVESEAEIKKLELELLNEQNKLAIESETKGSSAAITPEALRILEQEYEPRFEALYKGSTFRQEFLKDFFSLIPSDRLRVEASIANLNNDFEKTMTNVRPHSVETRSKVTVNEYPFGHDRVGRIYLKKENNKVQFFRISRTKNGRGTLDQKQVIAWIKVNI